MKVPIFFFFFFLFSFLFFSFFLFPFFLVPFFSFLACAPMLALVHVVA